MLSFLRYTYIESIPPTTPTIKSATAPMRSRVFLPIVLSPPSSRVTGSVGDVVG